MSKRKHLDLDGSMMTSIKTSAFKFDWKIDDFDKILATKTVIKSETFSSRHNPNFQWYFSLKLITDDDCGANTLAGRKTFISVYLNCVNSNSTFVKLNLNCSILNENNTKSYDVSLTDDSPTESQSYGFEKFISVGNLQYSKNIFMPNNALNLFMEITLIHFVSSMKDSKKKCVKESERDKLQKKVDLTHFYNNADFTDLTIICDDVELLVHKNILAANSEVLYKKLVKLNETQLRLPVPLPIMQELLSFMYRGFCPNMRQYAEELYETSVRLKISNLGDLIEKNLSETITLKNALTRLLWAENSNAQVLKTNTEDFIIKNIKEILKTDEFQSFIKDHPNLTKELFNGIVQNYVEDKVET